MKEQLIFSTDDAQSLLDSDNVGAYVRASDGTLIAKETVNSVDRLAVDSTLKDGEGNVLTSTDVGGKQALDVRVAEGINVEVDLDAADDSVAAYLNDGAGNAIGSTGGAIHISDAGGSVTVDAVDLDIRDLTFATDSVDVSNSTNVAIVDGGGSITVDAVDLDIRDLSAASDSVQSNLFDGAGTALTSTLVGADQALDVNIVASEELTVNDAALADTAIATAANTLASANTAQDVVASPLANRKYLSIYNLDNKKIFVGASGVTAANGFPMSPGSSLLMRAGASVDIEYVGSTGQTPEIRTLELS